MSGVGTGLIPQERVLPRSRRVQPVFRKIEGILVLYLVEQPVATMLVRDPEILLAAEVLGLTGAFAFGDVPHIARVGGRSVRSVRVCSYWRDSDDRESGDDGIE